MRTFLIIVSALFLLPLHAQSIMHIETVEIYIPGEDDDHYVNNAVTAFFKGKYYCMWQSSAKDEDASDTHVVVSTSRDGYEWSRPKTLAEASDSTWTSPGGWIVNGDTLTAFINILPDIKDGGTAHYITTGNGRKWSDLKPVLMADGTPMEGILEQDPHLINAERIIGAAHFKPGLKARPIYTEDLSGHTGWKIGKIEMEDRGTQSRGIEPSLYEKTDGTIVMLFRDQASSFRKIASESRDLGETWSTPYLTALIDSRSKQCAGNLPDGTAFIVSNPAASKDRTTLGLAFSLDGETFGEYVILRSPADLRERKYEGRYKTPGYSYPKAMLHDGKLLISDSENKERIQLTIVSINLAN